MDYKRGNVSGRFVDADQGRYDGVSTTPVLFDSLRTYANHKRNPWLRSRLVIEIVSLEYDRVIDVARLLGKITERGLHGEEYLSTTKYEISYSGYYWSREHPRQYPNLP
jgi:hypothetical protein